MRKIDLTGQRFGRLVVISENTKKKKHDIYWWCQCDCGEITCAQGNNLKSGHKKSCGCLSMESRTKHNFYKTNTYSTWQAMKSRCQNPKNRAFKHYGGRGISVCERWQDFTAFLSDMGEKPSGKCLERIDNDGNYCPENCKWETQIEQMHNIRCKGYSWDAKKKCGVRK